jgi:hypothetical protein
MSTRAEHLQKSLEVITKLVQAAADEVEAMKVGDKSTVRDLITNAIKKAGVTMDYGQVYPIVKVFLDQCPGLEIKPGKGMCKVA